MSNVYEIITKQILQKLDEGVKPWKARFEGTDALPKNLISNKNYQGINVLLLLSQRYTSPFWATYKQITDKGGKIKKGEKHTKIVFWTTIKKENEDEDKERVIPFMRYYRVWNIEQTEGINLPESVTIVKKPTETELREKCENIILKFKDCPEILYGRTPHYNPTYDQIGMPKMELFHFPECFYSTLFHEMVHSTSHMTRLNRERSSYALEELVAEIGACFLSGIAGISDKVFDDQVSYIHAWGKKTEMSCIEWKNFLKDNPRALVKAASQAQKAADYIQGITKMSKLKEKETA